jgi:hypothetical protein
MKNYDIFLLFYLLLILWLRRKSQVVLRHDRWFSGNGCGLGQVPIVLFGNHNYQPWAAGCIHDPPTLLLLSLSHLPHSLPLPTFPTLLLSHLSHSLPLPTFPTLLLSHLSYSIPLLIFPTLLLSHLSYSIPLLTFPIFSPLPPVPLFSSPTCPTLLLSHLTHLSRLDLPAPFFSFPNCPTLPTPPCPTLHLIHLFFILPFSTFLHLSHSPHLSPCPTFLLIHPYFAPTLLISPLLSVPFPASKSLYCPTLLLSSRSPILPLLSHSPIFSPLLSHSSIFSPLLSHSPLLQPTVPLSSSPRFLSHSSPLHPSPPLPLYSTHLTRTARPTLLLYPPTVPLSNCT